MLSVYITGVSSPYDGFRFLADDDLADKHTGFMVDSTFDLNSSAAGSVSATGFQIDISADVLDYTVFDESFSYSGGGSIPYNFDNGVIQVTGSFDYGASLNPSFNNDLILDGISGTAWVDPSLTITIPLGEARIPLLSIPGIADIVFGASASIGFQTASGYTHTLEMTPSITSGGLGIDTFEMNPALLAGITGYGELDLGWGAGTAGASLTGTLEQGLIAHYSDVSGWSNSAPGSLTLSGDAYYNSLWGFGPSGAMDLFEWELASWDFLDGSGSSTTATQDHTYESGGLSDPWRSHSPGPHDSLTFMIDYVNPGSSPQLARLLVDEDTYYDMTLAGGTADSGVYSVTVLDVAMEAHDYHFVFIDDTGEYHVQGFDMGPDRVGVLHVDPVDGGPMVARDADVTIEFTDEMDHQTLDSSTVHIVGSTSGLHDGNYQYSGTTLVIDPFVDFAPGETVTVTVTRNALSASGRQVAEDYTFRFEAIDATPTPIEVGGTLTSSTTWISGNVYLVTSDVTVPAGMTLRIEPGVVVKFEAVDAGYNTRYRYRHDIIVHGVLDLQSTSSQMVVFTSSRDDVYGGDSNGDGTGSSPSSTNWGALKYYNQDNLLHDAIIRYGGLGYTYQKYSGPSYYDQQIIWVAGSELGTLEVRDCVIENTYEKAVYAESLQSPWVHDNTIRNAAYGVYGTSATVESNTFDTSSNHAVYLSGTAVVEGNTITDGGTGIRVADGSVRNNIISGGNSWGIYLTGTGTPTVSGNTVTGNAYPIYQGPGDPIYSGNDFSGNTNSVIGVGGTLTNGAVWENVQGLGMPYMVYSDVTVPADQTLTIDGGVVVKFDSGRNLSVNGTLDLQGTPSQAIIFTSRLDDTYGGDSNGDGAASSPGAGNWGSLNYANPNNVLHDAVIRYGGDPMIRVSGSALGTFERRFPRGEIQ